MIKKLGLECHHLKGRINDICIKWSITQRRGCGRDGRAMDLPINC